MSYIPESSYWFIPPAEFGVNYVRIHYAKLIGFHLADIYESFGNQKNWCFRIWGIDNGPAMTSKYYESKEQAQAAFELFWRNMQDFKIQHIARCDRASGKECRTNWMTRLKIQSAAAMAWFRTTDIYQDYKQWHDARAN